MQGMYIALLTALIVVLALGAHDATAKRVTLRDDQGRAIHFDVRGAQPNLAQYLDVLQEAHHGDEISRVVIQIGPRRRPSSDAYRVVRHTQPGRIVLPRDSLAANRRRLLHAYGHHIDFSHRGQRCPVAPCSDRGTPGGIEWFATRNIAGHLKTGRVGGDDREVGRRVTDLWAGDFLALHGDPGLSVSWLQPAGPDIRAAMVSDLADLGIFAGGGARGRISGNGGDPAVSAWVVLERAGLLPVGGTAQLRFAGPRQAIDYVGEVSGVDGLAGVRNELICDGDKRTGSWASDGKVARITTRRLPTATCSVLITNAGPVPVNYTATLKVSQLR